MPISFYMDAHIPRVVAVGLRMRSVDVLTAQEDGADRLSDLSFWIGQPNSIECSLPQLPHS